MSKTNYFKMDEVFDSNIIHKRHKGKFVKLDFLLFYVKLKKDIFRKLLVYLFILLLTR